MTALALAAAVLLAADPLEISGWFSANNVVPARYSCVGPDLSPKLSWTAGPEGTKSYVVLVEDPDAPGGTFVHWVVFDYLPSEKPPALPEALPNTRFGSLEAQAVAAPPHGPLRQGKNDFGKLGWRGPCPPPGPAHHYRFQVFALDRTLGLKPGVTAAAVRAAMKGHVLAQGELVGTFAR